MISGKLLTLEILVAIVVGVPIGVTHDAFVFWLVLQLVKNLPSTMNWFLCSVVHGWWLHFMELPDWLAVFDYYLKSAIL